MTLKMLSKVEEKTKPKAYLFGPFIGEFSWELYRFAPYAIYIKKNYPKCKVIVLTRQQRFDLYGHYADILIPLRLTNDDKLIKRNFTIDGFDLSVYETIRKYFFDKYKKSYDILECFTPSINAWRSKIKWQFPRDKMSYDFLPRVENKNIIKKLFSKKDYILIDNNLSNEEKIIYNENVFYFDELVNILLNNIDYINSTIVGCLIEFIKLCKVVICNSNSKIFLISLLLKKNIILVNDNITDDNLKLLNPFNVKVVKTESVKDGVNIYENSI